MTLSNFFLKNAMFTPYFEPYSEVVKKKNNNKNCSVSSLVSKNTICVIVSLLLPKRQQVNNRNAKKCVQMRQWGLKG